ncbi:VOC family protein [Nocardia sp. NPDC056952]|uniref:VOC family protein n=1 Tax=Nocardia sp. NPDC056952 TaxID=3345979 RepID=UPI0036370818
MAIARSFVNICSDQLAATRDFYVDLLGFQVAYDSDWFVQLIDSDSGTIIGIMARDHELVPDHVRGGFGGSYITIVVDDVETIYARAKDLGIPIVEEPRDLFYGQRRLLVTDPNRFLVDVSSPTTSPPTDL